MASPRKMNHPWQHRLRVFTAALLGTICCLALGTYTLVYWLEHQILTTDNWVHLVSPLPKNEEVATALGNFISEKLFIKAQVEEKVSDALPPRAQFLAAPLTSQLQELTARTSQRLVASDQFQTIWEGANRLTLNRLLATARGQTPPLESKINERFDIDLSDATQRLRAALGSVGEAIPTLQPAAERSIAISTDLRMRAERVRQFIRTTDFLASILPLTIIVSLLGTLALSRSRYQNGLRIIIGTLVVLLLELIIIRWLHQETLDQVRNPSNITAVSYIYEALVNGLKQIIYITAIGVGLIGCFVVCAGPAPWAVAMRSYIHLDRLRKTQIFYWWRLTREGARKWERLFWILALIAALGTMALFATLTGQAILTIILLAAGFVALVHIIATPHGHVLKRTS